MGAAGDRGATRALQRADELFTAGRFEDARPLYEEWADYEPAAGHVHLHLGRLALLGDEPERCEHHLLLAYRLGEPAALAPLGDLYRRHGRFPEAAACFDTLGQRGMAKALAAFEGRRPFEQEGSGEVTLPLVCSDPLPLVTLNVNGRPAHFLLDSAAEQTALDTELAREAGVEMGAAESGLFSGGRVAPLRHAILGALELGGHTLRNIPVHVQPLRETFSDHLCGQPVEGICGCDVMYRFRAVLDPQQGSLSLAPRTAHDARAQGTGDVPLWLAGSHLPIVRIAVNQRYEIPALVDTGQSGMLFAASAALTRSVGAKPAGPWTSGQGGGGQVPLIPITLTALALGELCRRLPSAACMPYFPLEYRFGFHIGGLVSYDFFRSRGLVFDFAAMRLRLAPAAPAA